MAGLQRVAAPQEEPVSLAVAKTHLRLTSDDTTQDALIQGLITSAREQAEAATNRKFITQTWKLTLDTFPYAGRQSPAYWLNLPPLQEYTVYAFRSDTDAIRVPFPPLQSVTSIKYYDPSGEQQTIDSSLYIVDTASEPARIVPVPNYTWPTPQYRINAVEVVFDAGYGDATLVPQCISRWMLLRVGAMFENREEVVVDHRITSVDLAFVDSLLDPVRVLLA